MSRLQPIVDEFVGTEDPEDTPVLIGDYSKLHKQTGWEPRIEFEQTIEDTIESTRVLMTQER